MVKHLSIWFKFIHSILEWGPCRWFCLEFLEKKKIRGVCWPYHLLGFYSKSELVYLLQSGHNTLFLHCPWFTKIRMSFFLISTTLFIQFVSVSVYELHQLHDCRHLHYKESNSLSFKLTIYSFTQLPFLTSYINTRSLILLSSLTIKTIIIFLHIYKYTRHTHTHI